MKPAAAIHGTARASPSRSRPLRRGLKTAGPRMAPKTAPKRTSAIPRARRVGGYMSPAAVRASSEMPPAAPTQRSPGTTPAGESAAEPSAVSNPPMTPSPKPTARTGIRPKRSMARPAGRAANAPVARTSAGPRPSSPSISTTSAKVIVATAAESCSVAELAASAAERSAVLRPIASFGGSFTSLDRTQEAPREMRPRLRERDV